MRLRSAFQVGPVREAVEGSVGSACRGLAEGAGIGAGGQALLEAFPELRLDPSVKATWMYGVRESVAHGPDRLPVLLE